MQATASATPAPLPERLRAETRELHAAAERSGAMGELVQGRLGLQGYRAMLRNLHLIYEALEAALDARRADPRVAPLRMPELYRSVALSQDLVSLLAACDEAGLDAETDAVEEAAAAYAQRLRHIAGGASPALVAHAYVRYLGDLHGGQALKRVVTRAYGLDARATHFYEFGDDDAVNARRQAFRAALAALKVTPAESDLIVAEARWAFQQHQRLFEQLHSRGG